MDHFIITRFQLPDMLDDNIRQSDKYYLSRFNLFKSYTYPSIIGQTCQNFTWIIATHVTTSSVIKQMLKDLIQSNNRIVLLECDSNWRNVVTSYIREHTSANHVIMTRIDDDDLLYNNAIRDVQHFYHPDVKFHCVYFANIYHFHADTGRVDPMIGKGAAAIGVSTITNRAMYPDHNIYNYNHNKLLMNPDGDKNYSLTIRDTGCVFYTQHAYNHSKLNSLKLKSLQSEIYDKDFYQSIVDKLNNPTVKNNKYQVRSCLARSFRHPTISHATIRRKHRQQRFTRRIIPSLHRRKRRPAKTGRPAALGRIKYIRRAGRLSKS